MNIIFKKDRYIYFLIIFILFIGLYTFKDYGIGIENTFRENQGFIG